MFPNLEVRHLHAAVVLAEELNFTKAAHRLHIMQSALSKQITEVEEQHSFRLFSRNNKRHVELTEVGRIFVEEARSALRHIERAVQLGRAAREGRDNILTVGHSPDADQASVSGILAIHLPLYPNVRIQLISEFSSELVRSVIAGELDLALVTAPLENSQITAVAFAQTPSMRFSHRPTRLLKRSTSPSKIWRTMNGFCWRGEFTPSFMAQSWTRRDVRESLRNTRTTLLRLNRRFTWYPSTLAWPSSPNLWLSAFSWKV